MSNLKAIEKKVKRFLYFIFGLIFRNKNTELPVDRNLIKRILVYRYDRLGDMVITLPFFHYLKTLIPDAEIDVITSASNFPFVQYDPAIIKFYKYEKSLSSFIKIVWAARKRRYDAIFCLELTKTTFAGLLSNFIGTKKTIKAIQLDKTRTRLNEAFFNVQFDVPRRSILMADMLLEYADMLFGTNRLDFSQDIELKIPDFWLEEADRFISKNIGSKFIIYNISAGKARRQFTPEKNAQILNALLDISKHKILLMHVPEDESFAVSVKKGLEKEIISLGENKGLLYISALIKRADMIISPDTSIVHIAASFDKPQLCLYPGNEEVKREWFPLGNNAEIVFSNTGVVETLEVDDIIQGFKKVYGRISAE